MPLIRTSRWYTRASDLDKSKFSGKVITGLTGNPDLPQPPVSPADLAVLKKVFDDAIIAAAGGGTLATARKDAAGAGLVNALDKDASYVDIECDDDLTILLSSGYESVSTNRSQTVLNAPEVVAADPIQTGKMKLRVTGDPNRKALLGRMKAQGGEFGPVLTFANSRKIIFDNLAAGTTYIFQLCGIGGSTGQSDWSDPVTRIAL